MLNVFVCLITVLCAMNMQSGSEATWHLILDMLPLVSNDFRVTSIFVYESTSYKYYRPTVAWVWCQGSPRGICGGHCGMQRGFLQVLWFSPVVIIPPMFHIHISFSYHSHYTVFDGLGWRSG